jgi:hypothetical protein
LRGNPYYQPLWQQVQHVVNIVHTIVAGQRHATTVWHSARTNRPDGLLPPALGVFLSDWV